MGRRHTPEPADRRGRRRHERRSVRELRSPGAGPCRQSFGPAAFWLDEVRSEANACDHLALSSFRTLSIDLNLAARGCRPLKLAHLEVRKPPQAEVAGGLSKGRFAGVPTAVLAAALGR